MAWLRRRGRVFYVEFPVRGRKHPRRVSTGTEDRRAAEAFLDEWQRLHPAGDDVAPARAALTVEAFGREWNTARKAKGVSDWDHELGHLENHVFPVFGARPLAAVTKAEMLEWISALGNKPGRFTPRLSRATVSKIGATCRAMFKEAERRDLIVVSPCVWSKAHLPRKVTTSRSRSGGLTADEVGLLIGDPRVPEDRRALYALELLTGMRTGEAAARRWRDWEPSFHGGLGRLLVATAYNTRHKVEKTTKTDVEKWVPVHPALAEVLRRWKANGWARAHGRAPGPEDLIVPATKGAMRSNTVSYRLWQRDLEQLGIVGQRHYETRSTFRSLALADPAVNERDLDRITHPSPKAASDLYDRPAILWPRLCAVVEAIKVTPHAGGEARRGLAVVGGDGYSGTGTPGDGGAPKRPESRGAAGSSAASGSTAGQGNRRRSGTSGDLGPSTVDAGSSGLIQASASDASEAEDGEPPPSCTRVPVPLLGAAAVADGALRAALEALAAGGARAARRLVLDALRALEDVEEGA